MILISHAGHPEVAGTMGRIPASVLPVQNTADLNGPSLPEGTPVAYIKGTTVVRGRHLGHNRRSPSQIANIQGPDVRDICYATQNRQSAVRELGKLVDVILVVGAANSSNSNRLREIGTHAGVASYLIMDGSELNPDWLGPPRLPR